MKLDLPLRDVERIAELLVDSVVRGRKRDAGLRNRVLAQLRTELNERQQKQKGENYETQSQPL